MVLALVLAGCGGRTLGDSAGSVGTGGATDATAGRANSGDGKAGNGGDSSADQPRASDGSAIELVASNSDLVDVFVGKLGIYVVFSGELRMFDHQGAPLMDRALEGLSTAAAFEDERLSIASGSTITTYDAQLQVQYTFLRPEHCEAIARFSKERIVCSSSFYGYTVVDGTSGRVLSGPDSQPSATPLLRVPGRDEFILKAGMKPLSNLAMARLTSDNQVLFLDEMPLTLVGRYNPQGFDGSPIPALITNTGQHIGLLVDCTAMTNRPSSPCFLPGNPSQAIPGGSELVRIAPAPAEHQFFGLVDTVNPTDPRPCLVGGCELELIDDLQDRVLRHSHVEFANPPTDLLAFRWDAAADAAVLGLTYIQGRTEDLYHYRVVLQPF